MARLRSLLLVASGFTAALFLSAGPARGDCSPECWPLLCADANDSIVTGTLVADPAQPSGVAITLEAILRLAPGAVAAPPGERLKTSLTGAAGPGPVVALFRGGDLSKYGSVVAIDPDGIVRCGGSLARTSPSFPRGVTPLRLAMLAGDRNGCRQQLRAEGYIDYECNDDGGPFACAAASAPGGRSWLWLAGVGVLGWLRLALRRNRQRANRR